MKVHKYKRKDGFVQAAQWFKLGDHPLVKATPSVYKDGKAEISGYHSIETPNGNVNVYAGDWIVTRALGDSYPVNPRVFDTLYDKVEDET